MAKCEKCRCHLKEPVPESADISQTTETRVDPVLSRAQERVRELELELAQTKLAHVEAECRNQVNKFGQCNSLFTNF